MTHTLDFVLQLNTCEIIIVDCKGCKETVEEIFKIKWKIMKLKYPSYDYKIAIWDKKVKWFVKI